MALRWVPAQLSGASRRRFALHGSAKAQTLLEILGKNPYQNPPPYEKLVGDLTGAYSRRINIQHRQVYQVLNEKRVVKVIRLWTRANTLPFRTARPQKNILPVC